LPIAPKPRGTLGLEMQTVDNIAALPCATSPGAERRVYNFIDPTVSGRAVDSGGSPTNVKLHENKHDTVDRSKSPEPRHRHSPQGPKTHYDFNALVKEERQEEIPTTTNQTTPLNWSASPGSGSFQYSHEVLRDSNGLFPAAVPVFQTHPATSNWEQPNASTSLLALATTVVTCPTGSSSVPKRPGEAHVDYKPYPVDLQREPYHVETYPSHTEEWRLPEPSQLTALQTHQIEDKDDLFDVSDEEVPMDEQDNSKIWDEDVQIDHLKNNDLGIVVALQANQDRQGLGLRSFTSFIDRPDMLATYVPSSQSTPLRDAMTARIFCHFVNVTGPSMSLFERHPANPSVMFQGAPVQKSQQHIWTCGFSGVWNWRLVADLGHRYISHSCTAKSRPPTCHACTCKSTYRNAPKRIYNSIAKALCYWSTQSSEECQPSLSAETPCYPGCSNVTRNLRVLVSRSSKMEQSPARCETTSTGN